MVFKKKFLFLYSIFLLTLFSCTSPEKNTTQINKEETNTTKSSTIKFYENRAKNLDEGLKELAISIGNEMQKENINTVAVYDFLRIDGEKDDFGRLLSEELTTNLFGLRKFQIIERNMLESILEENKLQLSQVVDQKTAKEIGKITGVDALFLGTYIDSGDHIRINARIISTETGAIFSASSISVIKEIFISQLIKVDNSENNKTIVDTQVFSYFKKSAEKADKLAQSWLGYMYRYGKGVMQNFNEAIYWYKKAIDKDDDYSKNQLGEMYFYGEGLNKDLNTAFSLFKETADKGNAKGASWLGYMYRYAQGVNRDYGQALYWFRQAEAKGDAYSMNQIGEMYYYGQGVSIDYQKARMYFENAKNKGNKTAEENLKSKF